MTWRRGRPVLLALAIATTLGCLPRLGDPRSAGGVVGGGSRQPRLLVGVSAETGETLFEAGSENERRFFHVFDAARGLVFGEETPCGRAQARGDQQDDVFFVARDDETGEPRWEVPVKGTSLQRGPVRVETPRLGASGGAAIVVEGRDGSVLGLDPQTGERRWRRDVGAFEPLASTRQRVLLGTSRDLDDSVQSLVVLDRETGEVAWRYRGRDQYYFAMQAMSAEVVVVYEFFGGPGTGQDAGGTLRAFDAPSGRLLWEQPAIGGGAGIFINKSVVVFPGGPGSLTVAFDPQTGAKLWESNPAGGYGERAAGDDLDAILAGYGSFSDGQLVATNPADGSIRWMFPVSGGTRTVAAGRNLVIQASGLEWVGIDAATGAERWRRIPPPLADSAVVAGDTVYVSGGCDVLEP